MKEIILNDLPKISLNKWYAGSHWSKRKKIKDTYKMLVRSQCKDIFFGEKYKVLYVFHFSKNPLDASNCVAMVKMIEDTLFPNDGYKVVTEITIKSRKSKKDYVKITIT